MSKWWVSMLISRVLTRKGRTLSALVWCGSLLLTFKILRVVAPLGRVSLNSYRRLRTNRRNRFPLCRIGVVAMTRLLFLTTRLTLNVNKAPIRFRYCRRVRRRRKLSLTVGIRPIFTIIPRRTVGVICSRPVKLRSVTVGVS